MEFKKLEENETDIVTEVVENIANPDLNVDLEAKSLVLMVSKSQQPVIQTNYSKLKVALQEKLEEYKDLIVTDETLKQNKKLQGELASLRIALDSSRKEKKKELEKPIKEFDEQLKELIGLVEKVETPLKAGISVFDEKKRQKMRDFATTYFEKLADEENLSAEFRTFAVPKECDVLNVTQKAIRSAVEIQINAMKTKQDAHIQKNNTVQAAIDAQNERNTTKLNFDSFRFILDSAASLGDILNDINKRGQEIYDAEHEPSKATEPTITDVVQLEAVDNPVSEPLEPSVPLMTPFMTIPEEVIQPPIQDTVFQPEPIAASIDRYEVTFTVNGTFNEIASLSNYINDNNISKVIISQKKL